MRDFLPRRGYNALHPLAHVFILGSLADWLAPDRVHSLSVEYTN